jgi:hypothetical protein
MKALLAFLLCSAVLASADRHNNNHNGGRRRNMLDQNRTPRRGGLVEQAEQLAGLVEEGADDSCDLKGAWYNQHGSELILNQTEDGRLIGEFRTAVRLGGERDQDYSERSTSAVPIRGHIHGRMFTFHAYWTEKQALTTWSGQCQRNCDFGWLRSERHILHASWLIKTSTSQCHDYWAAARIGEDIFTRTSMKPGPRRADEVSGVGVDTA